MGLSDHTPGIGVSIAAIALGASIIEKHLTLNQKSIGPDHNASLNPVEFKTMVKFVRETEVSLGSFDKVVTKSEKKNQNIIS